MRKKKLKFTDLTKLAQVKAVYDYLVGWSETHDENDMSFEEAFGILEDSDDVFNKNGKVIPDQW